MLFQDNVKLVMQITKTSMANWLFSGTAIIGFGDVCGETVGVGATVSVGFEGQFGSVASVGLDVALGDAVG
jgi:hypothetical protein